MNGRGAGDPEGPAIDTVPGDDAPESGSPAGDHAPESGARNRRSSERIEVLWSVDCETDDTFLYAAITNISAMGIFVRTDEPLPVGTLVRLRFVPPASGPEPQADAPFLLSGMVQWVNRRRPSDNPNPGMGIRFSNLSLPERERIVEIIHTIAYLREEPAQRLSEGN
jgi:type IV pilus assembly protein PilZ